MAPPVAGADIGLDVLYVDKRAPAVELGFVYPQRGRDLIRSTASQHGSNRGRSDEDATSASQCAQGLARYRPHHHDMCRSSLHSGDRYRHLFVVWPWQISQAMGLPFRSAFGAQVTRSPEIQEAAPSGRTASEAASSPAGSAATPGGIVRIATTTPAAAKPARTQNPMA